MHAEKLYVRQVFMIFALAMASLISTNYFVDPAQIYHQTKFIPQVGKVMTNTIISSERGVLLAGLGERFPKWAMAVNSGFECAITGASPVVQISKLTMPDILPQCKNLINLGVSHGGIQDLAITSFLLTKAERPPHSVFISIESGRTLVFDKKNINWFSNKETYELALKEMELLDQSFLDSNKVRANYITNLTKNLLSFDYFFASISFLLSKESDEHKQSSISKITPFYDRLNSAITYPSPYDKDIGPENTLMLQDGSLLYDRTYLKDHRQVEIQIDESITKAIQERKTFKLPVQGAPDIEPSFTQEGLDFLKKIITMLQSKNIKVNLLLLPEFPYTHALSQAHLPISKKTIIHGKKRVNSLIALDKAIQRFTAENNLNVYGSYFFNEVSCTSTEFFDSIHATNKCLRKVLKKVLER